MNIGHAVSRARPVEKKAETLFHGLRRNLTTAHPGMHGNFSVKGAGEWIHPIPRKLFLHAPCFFLPGRDKKHAVRARIFGVQPVRRDLFYGGAHTFLTQGWYRQEKFYQSNFSQELRKIKFIINLKIFLFLCLRTRIRRFLFPRMFCSPWLPPFFSIGRHHHAYLQRQTSSFFYVSLLYIYNEYMYHNNTFYPFSITLFIFMIVSYLF